jgi:hypothetical protein
MSNRARNGGEERAAFEKIPNYRQRHRD